MPEGPKADPATGAPAQTELLAGVVIEGRGLTVIVYVAGVPTQPLRVGVTVTVPDMGLAVPFVPVKEA